MAKYFKGVISLTLGSGEPIYVNPQNVVAVTKATGTMDNIDYSVQLSRSGPNQSDKPRTAVITTATGAFHLLIVREPVDEVLQSLAWKVIEE